MADVLSGFSGFANAANIGMYIMWFILGLFGALIMTAMVIMVILKMKEIPVYELDMVTRRLKQYSAREKKYKSGQKLLFIGKLKKWMPQIQQEDKYLFGKKDAILLIKDNNGLHHTARLPKLAELKKWHEVMYGTPYDELVNSPNKPTDVIDIVDTIYLMPNPKEKLEWLADQAVQANKEFAMEWWKSPTVMIIAAIFLSAMTFIITIIIAKRM